MLNYKNNQEPKIILNILETDIERIKKQISVNRIQHLRCPRRGLPEFPFTPKERQKEGWFLVSNLLRIQINDYHTKLAHADSMEKVCWL